MKKFFSAAIFILCMIFMQNSFAAMQFNYQAHVQNIGWTKPVSNGDMVGTTGKNLRIEAVMINLMDGSHNMIQYCGHVENIGWMGWQISGGVVGTTGKNLRLEAIRIRLVKGYENKFDIYYRTHVQNGGWLGWAKNGEPAGTQGASLRMEALQIKLVPKGKHFNQGGKAFYLKENGISSNV